MSSVTPTPSPNSQRTKPYNAVHAKSGIEDSGISMSSVTPTPSPNSEGIKLYNAAHAKSEVKDSSKWSMSRATPTPSPNSEGIKLYNAVHAKSEVKDSGKWSMSSLTPTPSPNSEGSKLFAFEDSTKPLSSLFSLTPTPTRIILEGTELYTEFQQSGKPPSPFLSDNSGSDSSDMLEDSLTPTEFEDSSKSPSLPSDDSHSDSSDMLEDSLTPTPTPISEGSNAAKSEFEDSSRPPSPPLSDDSVFEVGLTPTPTPISNENSLVNTDGYVVPVVPVLQPALDPPTVYPVTTAGVQSLESFTNEHEGTPLIRNFQHETYPRQRQTAARVVTSEVSTSEHSGIQRVDTYIEQEFTECAHDDYEFVEDKCCCCKMQCTCHQGGPLLNKTLCRGRDRGWAMFKIIVFPHLIRDFIRSVWVIVQFLTSLVGFGLSLASTLKQDPVEIFNIVHLALVSLSILLALFDMFCSLRCKTCCSCSQTCDLAQYSRRCSCCIKCIDIVRILIAEALIYPLIICNIFESVTGRAFEGKTSIDYLSFSLFILSCFSYVLYVFVARIAIMTGLIHKTHSARKRPTFKLNWKETYSISALTYQIVFYVHLLFQMIAQVLALVAIGACTFFENHHFYEDGNTDESIFVSPYLWYMIVAGYVTPVLGFFSFFLVTYYWAQEFPIALCLDMISLWKMKRGPEEFINFGERVLNPRDRLTSSMGFLYMLVRDYIELHDEKWWFKFTYPFRTPVIVFLCIIYAFLHIGFAVSSFLVLDRADKALAHPGLFSWPWLIYVYACAGFGVVANIYAFTVAAFGTVLLFLFLDFLVLLVLCIIALLALLVLCILVLLALLVPCSPYIVCSRLICRVYEEHGCEATFCCLCGYSLFLLVLFGLLAYGSIYGILLL